MKEKMLPQNEEAEYGVVACVLTSPSSLSNITDFLRPEDFYYGKLRLIYEAMLSLDAHHTSIDEITVGDELMRRGHWEQVGGYSYLSTFMDHRLSAKSVETYASIVHELAQFREVIKLATEMVGDAYAQDPQTVAKAEGALHRIAQGKKVSRVVSLRDAVSQYMSKLELLHEQRKRGVVTGVPTGFTTIDHILGGLQPSDLITLAARPGKGKTSLALNIAQHVMEHSSREGFKVMMFSMEMNTEQLVQRLISMETGINQSYLRTGDLDDEDWNPIENAASKLSQGPMWIDDTAGLSLTDLRSRARRVQSEHGLDLIIADYMQLMKATTDDGKSPENRVQEVSLLSRGLKEIARELNVPVLALAQLSRAVEQRTQKIPQLSDLRESGSIEQDSDVVAFIYQDEEVPVGDDGSVETKIIVAKHRNGPTGVATLRFLPYLTKFEDPREYDMEVYRRER